MSSNTPINDTDTLDDLSSNIHDAILEQISNEKSILRDKLQGKKFSDTIQIQLTLRETFREIWKNGGEIAAKFGFLGNPKTLETEHYKLERELDALSENIYTLLEEAIVEDTTAIPSQYEIRLDKEAVQKIANRLKRELPGIREPRYLQAKEPNQLEAITEARLIAMLKQAPEKLRGELRATGYPSHIKNQKLYEGKVFKTIETFILSGSMVFMTYGWHGLIYNGLDTLTRDTRNISNSVGFAEQIMTNPTLQNSLTWGGGFMASTLIAWGLLKGARKRREYLIKDAEASHKSGKNIKVGNFAQRNGLFIVFGAIALGGALGEASGILAHEVQGVYTAQKAHEVGMMVQKILDTKNLNSPGGELAEKLAGMQSQIETDATNWYNAEVTRPGASGTGPAAVAKQYLKDGKESLDYTILGKDTNLQNLVNTTDNKIAALLPNIYAEGYNTFPLQAEKVSKIYSDTTENIANMAYGEVTVDEKTGTPKTGLYRSVYEKGKKAKTADYLRAQDEFQKELDKYEKYMMRLNSTWGEVSGVYRNYINQVSAVSDAKYNSKLNVDVPVQDIHIDLSKIREKVAEVPKLEGKSPLEYWDELNRLTGVEGGITSGERNFLIAAISVRSGIIELFAILMLFVGVNRVSKHYKTSNNLLSEREKEIVDTHYENLVTAIENTFSGDNWIPIFPNHSGISREEADYLARKLLIAQDPTLDKWLPIRHESGEHIHITKKYGKKIHGFYKKIITGDTITEAELRLNTINDVLSELATKARTDKSGLGIPLKEIITTIRNVLPDPKVIGSKNTAVDIFSDKVSQIATNMDKIAELSIQTQNQDTTERTAAFESTRQEIENWAMHELDIWLGQCETTVRNQITVDVSLSDFIRDGRKFQQDIQNQDNLTGTWIASIRKMKQKLIDIHAALKP